MKIAIAALAAGMCHGGGGDTPDASNHHADGAVVADASSQHDAAVIADASNADGSGTPGTIFTIVLENHDYAEIVGSTNAPYINSLIAQGALATNYKDSGTHPSLPNYLVMASGDRQYPGYIDVNPTTYPFPVEKPNLAARLETAA